MEDEYADIYYVDARNARAIRWCRSPRPGQAPSSLTKRTELSL